MSLIHCPICKKDLPESAFGVCRDRKTGRNLYDKECIRAKRNAQRRDLRKYKELCKKLQAQGIKYRVEAYEPKKVVKPAPVELVREAIRKGARTQREIGSETKLRKDQIGDSLAQLLLWSKEIKSEVIDGTRVYLLNNSGAKEVRTYKPAIPFAELVGRAA